MTDRSRPSRVFQLVVAAVAGAVLLAGCGGSAHPSTTAAAPRIPRALGVALAARADRISVALESGDACDAAGRADRLKVAVGNAVASDAIPARLQAPALAAAARLATSIVCRPPTTTTTTATTTAATTTLSTCDRLQARKQQLEDEKHALDQDKKTVDKERTRRSTRKGCARPAGARRRLPLNDGPGRDARLDCRGVKPNRSAEENTYVANHSVDMPIRATRRLLENEFVRFCAVGASGYTVNLAVYAALLAAGLHYLAAAAIAFIVAAGNNYAWNRAWTFRTSDVPVLGQGARALVVSALSLGANQLFLYVLVTAGAGHLSAQAVAIVLATPFSFAANKLWAFAEPSRVGELKRWR